MKNKAVINTKKGDMPEQQFDLAMKKMKELIDVVDDAVNLPDPVHQLIEWNITTHYASTRQWLVLGYAQFIRDTKYDQKDKRFRKIEYGIFGSDWEEVAFDIDGQAYQVVDFDIESILIKMPVDALIPKIVNRINCFLKFCHV